MNSSNRAARKRTYRSPRRQEQAEATRQKILKAAHHLFLKEGYAATTLAAIARAAQVALPTITAAYGTKLALLQALIQSAVRGDAQPVPLAQRTAWTALLAETDPEAQLCQYAAAIRAIHVRTTDIFEIVRGAATADAAIAALRRSLSTSRMEDIRLVARSLMHKGALRPGLNEDHVADLLWALGSAEMFRMLVVERGWSPDRYERWLAENLCQTLLVQPSSSRTQTIGKAG
jgi:AcrR family transcriptional regulator